MSIRTRVLAVCGFFSALCFAFYLRTRWGPPLLDVGYVHSPTGSSKPISTVTFKHTDVDPTYTPSASWDVYDCPYGPVIGIELGNDYSRVGLFDKSMFVLIYNDEGHRETPSYVTFTDQGPITGLKAKEQATSNPENTIYDFRRLLGRKFSDPTLQAEIDLLPYKVVEQEGFPSIKVRINGTEKLYSPEEVTAEILKRLKDAAEQYTRFEFHDVKITHAVISVPAYFTDAQRQATRDAGLIAGLNILHIIDESRAVGLAYKLEEITDIVTGRDRNSEVAHGSSNSMDRPVIPCPGIDDEYCYLVFNLERRGSDVAIMSADRGVFELLGRGESDLGSRELDHDLFVYLFNQAKGFFDFDISGDLEGIARLKDIVRTIQETLSTSPYAQIDGLWEYEGVMSFPMVVTRLTLEILHQSSYHKVFALVEQCLFDAKVDKSAIDALFITGEPLYTAKIRPILQEYFEGAKLYSDIKLDEIVVQGVASIARIYAPEDWVRDCGYDVPPTWAGDFVPLGLGIEIAGGFYEKIMHSNDVLPLMKGRIVTTATEGQEKVVLKVYEGHRPMVRHNRYLGSLELEISKKKRGEVEIVLVFEMYDQYGLIVRAKERGGKKEARVVFDGSTFPHDRSGEIEEVRRLTKEFWEADQQEKEQAITDNRWKEDDGSGVMVVKYPGETCLECDGRGYFLDSSRPSWWTI